MRFSGLYLAAAIVPLAAAAPPFVLQDSQRSAPAATFADERLPDLKVDDFLAVQHSIKESLEHAVDEGKRLISDTFELVEDFAAHHDSEGEEHPHPKPIHSVLDFSNYTVLEIINASWTGHHHDDGDKERFDGFERKLRRSAFPHQFEDSEGEHKPDPKHLPFHRLAGLLNFSPDAAAQLDKDNITLLAPDDWALTPPHKREDHKARFGHAGRMVAPVEEEEDEDETPFSRIPHPFHSKELSPRRLRKLAAASFEGDDDEEKKREFFKKLIAAIGKYHVVPHALTPRYIADHSTIPSGYVEARIRVEPALARFPFPHPTLRFNHYAWKRGPLIKAKNGYIYGLSAPLFPPLTPLNQLFLTPQFFSGFTNAIQKVDLEDALLPEHPSQQQQDSDVMVNSVVQELLDEHKLKVSTVFVPTNAVFHHLAPEIVAFLHSPIPLAKKILRYVLAGHISPGVAFFSDHFYNASAPHDQKLDAFVVKRETDVQVPLDLLEGPNEPPHFPGHPRPPPHAPEHPPHPKANVTHYVLPTLLTHFNPDATIKLAVFEYRLFGFGPKRRSIVVFPSHRPKKPEGDDGFEGPGGDKDHKHPHPVRVAFPDVPARAGAIHVLADQFLVPPPPPHHDDDGKKVNELDTAGRRARKEAKEFRKALAKLFV
ncbi:hypothetical protein JCM10207_001065 [Rhodosporidiobolus poonsookiae]